MEARLIELGLRWDEAGKKRNTWGDILAVIESEPPDGPIHRASDPKEWIWYTPHFNQIQTISELIATLTVLIGNMSGAKERDMPERAKRPWDKDDNTDVLSGDQMSLADLDDFAKLSME